MENWPIYLKNLTLDRKCKMPVGALKGLIAGVSREILGHRVSLQPAVWKGIFSSNEPKHAHECQRFQKCII